MTTVVSRMTDTGSKGYPLFRFGTGRKGGWKTSSPGRCSPSFFGGGGKQTSTKTQGVTQVQAAQRLKALLLHVWIDVFIMEWFTRVFYG